jgi:hypothetical protein
MFASIAPSNQPPSTPHSHPPTHPLIHTPAAYQPCSPIFPRLSPCTPSEHGRLPHPGPPSHGLTPAPLFLMAQRRAASADSLGGPEARPLQAGPLAGSVVGSPSHCRRLSCWKPFPLPPAQLLEALPIAAGSVVGSPSQLWQGGRWCTTLGPAERSIRLHLVRAW